MDAMETEEYEIPVCIRCDNIEAKVSMQCFIGVWERSVQTGVPNVIQ